MMRAGKDYCVGVVADYEKKRLLRRRKLIQRQKPPQLAGEQVVNPNQSKPTLKLR